MERNLVGKVFDGGWGETWKKFLKKCCTGLGGGWVRARATLIFGRRDELNSLDPDI